jgi:hypothetical protein
MSFVRKQKATAVKSHFQIELVPDPTQRFSDEKKLAQQSVIEQVTKVSSGLFVPNPAVKVDHAIKCGEFYNAGIRVDKLAKVMEDNHLVLRVSMKGKHIACAMATHQDLLGNKVISSPSGTFSLGIKNNFVRSIDFL